jgi:hypothetical protein
MHCLDFCQSGSCHIKNATHGFENIKTVRCDNLIDSRSMDGCIPHILPELQDELEELLVKYSPPSDSLEAKEDILLVMLWL